MKIELPAEFPSGEQSIEISDLIAESIASGDITKEQFLEARQWVRDTYYGKGREVKSQPELNNPTEDHDG